MLWDASAMKGYAIQAHDGTIGTVEEFLFEDTIWMIRWLVVDTGHWLSGRKVLLPPSILGHPDARSRRFPVNLTMQQVKRSPDTVREIDWADKSIHLNISRQRVNSGRAYDPSKMADRVNESAGLSTPPARGDCLLPMAAETRKLRMREVRKP